jgi:hypothetical protein
LQVNGSAIIDGTITTSKVALGSFTAHYEGNDQVSIPDVMNGEILIIQAVRYSTLSDITGAAGALGDQPLQLVIAPYNLGNGTLPHLGGGPFIRGSIVRIPKFIGGVPVTGDHWLLDNTGVMVGASGNLTITAYYGSGGFRRLRGVKFYVTRFRR